MKKLNFFLLLPILQVFTGCTNSNTEMKLKTFINEFEQSYAPVETNLNKVYFDAMVSGKSEDYKKIEELQLQISNFLSDTVRFKKVKEFMKSEEIDNDLLARQLTVIYNIMAPKQVEQAKLQELIKRSTELEQRFSTYRAKLNGQEVSDNVIDSILSTSGNSKELKNTWEASKIIGDAVSSEVIELVKLRNNIAKDLGYSNYHEMSLKVSEQNPAEIELLFDELNELTGEAFKIAKKEIDDYLIDYHKIPYDELQPWHYQNKFFQEAPAIYDIDLDRYYKDQDIVKMVSNYFSGIGLEVDDIIKRSDLFEKEGKNQHAFCTHIDRSGDVRVLANIRPNHYWSNTMLHELGHGVYDKYLDMDLPFFLRMPAHTFTTEAIANFFGRRASDPNWMKANLGIDEEEIESITEDVNNSLRLQQLVFSRWSQVMFRFEKSMYENPDQDLNQLWWDIVEKYQGIKKPEGRDKGDWAAKIHLALYPCYYHNYLMGELLASQLGAYIESSVLLERGSGFSDSHAIGEYLKQSVFEPAALYKWNDMIEQATGEKLTARYYAAEFVERAE